MYVINWLALQLPDCVLIVPINEEETRVVDEKR
jgi:hypothetical protein